MSISHPNPVENAADAQLRDVLNSLDFELLMYVAHQTLGLETKGEGRSEIVGRLVESAGEDRQKLQNSLRTVLRTELGYTGSQIERKILGEVTEVKGTIRDVSTKLDEATDDLREKVAGIGTIKFVLGAVTVILATITATGMVFGYIKTEDLAAKQSQLALMLNQHQVLNGIQLRSQLRTVTLSFQDLMDACSTGLPPESMFQRAREDSGEVARMLEIAQARAGSGAGDDAKEPAAALAVLHDLFARAAALGQSQSPEQLTRAIETWERPISLPAPLKDGDLQALFDRVPAYQSNVQGVLAFRKYSSAAAGERVQQDVWDSLAHFKRAIELRKTFARAYQNQAAVMVNVLVGFEADSAKKLKMLSDARVLLDHAVCYEQSSKTKANAYNTKAYSFVIEADTQRELGKLTEARECLRQARVMLARAQDLPQVPPIIYATESEVSALEVAVSPEPWANKDSAAKQARFEAVLLLFRRAADNGYPESSRRSLLDDPYLKNLEILRPGWRVEATQSLGL